MKKPFPAFQGVAAPVEFCVPTPPTTNHLFRNVKGRGRVKTAEYFDYEMLAITAIRQQKTPAVSGRVFALVGVERKSSLSDLDNRLKALFDVVAKAGIIENDKFITAFAVTWMPIVDGLTWLRIMPVAPINLRFEPSPDGASGGFSLVSPEKENANGN